MLRLNSRRTMKRGPVPICTVGKFLRDYKILSNNEFKRRNDFRFQPVHWFLLVLHYHKKNQLKTPELIDFFCQFRVL